MILAAASSNQTVKPLDGDQGKPRVSLEGYTGDVYSIAWSPNGKILATGSDDRTVSTVA
jgi:WD40 repeat protein